MHNVTTEKNYWLERLTRTTNELLLQSNKRKRKLKPITKSKFLLFHKKHFQNRSVLAEAGMLFLDRNHITSTKRGRGYHTLSDLGNTWVRSMTQSPSHFRRNNHLHSTTLKGSGTRPDNFANTIGSVN